MDLPQVYKSGELNYSDYKQILTAAKDDVKAIRQDIYNEATSNTDLALFNSQSKDSFWMMWIDIIAFISYILHGNWINYKQQLDEVYRRTVSHNGYWYAAKAKEFQYGDNLQASNGPVVYPVIDESKRIVTASAVKDFDGGLIIKVAKSGSNGLEPLSNMELAAFNGYMKNISDSGVPISVVSQNPDLLKVEIDIFYDPIIPLSILRNNIEQAINSYINNLPFDGVFRRTKLVDAIQLVEGVKDVKINLCEASTNYTGTPSFNPVPVLYETIAGYMNIDPNFPLNNQINFIAA